MQHKLIVEGFDFEQYKCTVLISGETESGYPGEEA